MDLQSLFANNELFQGGFVLVLTGALLAYLRNIPKLIGKFLKRQFVSTILLRDQEIVQWVGRWLSEGSYAKRCRLLIGRIDHSGNRPRLSLEPGLGTHLFRYEGHWILANHVLEDSGDDKMPFIKNQVMTLWALGRKKNIVRSVIIDAINSEIERRYGKQVAYINNRWGDWQELKTSDPRSAKSVVLPGTVKDDIIADAKWFLDSNEWHYDRGLPYRRGYLFHGPPGNGKSTMIQALAGVFDLPIYIISLAEKDLGDMHLFNMMAHLPQRAILALEDFDKVKFSENQQEGITLAGLLNAIDGIVAASGRILIITANDISNLPKPLQRRGRIDRTWHFPAPRVEQVEKMFTIFYPDCDGYASKFTSKINGHNICMASVQQHLVKYDSPEKAVDNINELLVEEEVSQ